MAETPLSVLIAGTSFGFPYGQGAATRAYMYAKALQSAGARVRVVSLLLPGKAPGVVAEPASGVYDGVDYEYACGTRFRPRSFIRRRLLAVRTVARVWRLIGDMSQSRTGQSVVLIYSESSAWIAVLSLMAHARHVCAVLDLCEYPLVGRLGSSRASLWRTLRRRVLFPELDAILPISTFLERYVRATPRSPATLLVPVMVDPDLFDGPESQPGEAPQRVVYCGALGRYAEVERVVRAFRDAASSSPGAELVLVGDGPPDRVARAKALVRELGIDGSVSFSGAVRREKLPGVFCSAAALVLPRSKGVFSAAGLPNKLGEYLASGHAVVVTATGDIPRYVEDGVSAYLVQPGDDRGFAERLRYVLHHPEEARAVGARGRCVALNEFDYRRHGRRLAAFLTQCGHGRPGSVHGRQGES